MSINYTDEFVDEEADSSENDAVEGEAGDIKSLRRAANGKKKLEQELAEAKRQLAFVKAGINPDDPRMKYFVKGYDGEMTAQAVRQAAMEAGFLQAAADASVPREVAQAQDRVVNAAIGGAYENDGESAALARMEQAMQEGGIDAMLDVARQFGIPIGTEM